MATEVLMPQLGEAVVEGTISRWLKDIGETVEEYEALLEVETDKVDTEVPSPVTGTILARYHEPGDVVQVGELLAIVGEPGESVDAGSGGQPATVTAQAGGADAPAQAPVVVAAPSSNGGNGGHPTGERPSGARISPLVANIAAEHGISYDEITAIPGSGREGRVTKHDMLAYIDNRGTAAPVAAPAPAVAPPLRVDASVTAPRDHQHAAPPAPGQPGELVPLSKMRRRIAEHMVMSKLQTAPHVTTVFEVDLSAIVAHRKANKPDYAQRGINLTFTAYFMAATAQALREHPMVNSQWTNEGVHLYRDVNIGMAVAIDDGLIVPVIKQADDLSLGGLARQVNDLAIRARDSKLTPDDVQAGTFTITNHGVSGSLFATPIINQPQTGILGVGAMQKRVVALEDNTIGIRPMIYITLTFDHRVLDGAGADFFVASIKRILENWA